MFEKKVYLERHADHLRRLMLREPRGYPALCCNVILPATDPAADAGFVIMEQVEYPPMSGSNTICVSTVLIETGMVPAIEPHTRLTLEAPAGLIEVVADVTDGKVTRVTFDNVPAFATHLDATIDVPEYGQVRVDVAYGGMFFVIAEAADLGIDLVPERGAEIARAGEMIKAAARKQLPVQHPNNPGIERITISQLTGPPTVDGATAKNAVVVSSGAFDWDRPSTWTGSLDRSPCGTGTCARMAVRHAKGQLSVDEPFHHEGILGTVWTGRLRGTTTVGSYDAVLPSLSGQGWITGIAQYVVDAEDPFPEGFTVGDLWA